MYTFENWLQIREESSVEQAAIKIWYAHPKAKPSTIAAIMRQRGFNVGITQVADIINNNPRANKEWLRTDEEKLKKMVHWLLKSNYNLNPEQILQILRNHAIFPEIGQVKDIVFKYKNYQNRSMGNPTPAAPEPKPLIKPAPDKAAVKYTPPEYKPEIPYNDDPESARTYFGYGTGGGKVTRSSRYN